MGATTSSPVGIVSPPSFPLSSLSVSLPTPRAWLSSFARSSIISVLDDIISIGSLTIIEGSETHVFGDTTSSGAHAELTVVNDAFWSRILVSADVGFSEAYMIGDVHVNSLKTFIDLWLDNSSSMSGLSSTLNRVVSTLSGLHNGIIGQTRSQARLNAIASYDQSNELFKAFLSKEMMYSCALWSDEENGVRGDLTHGVVPGDLEAAQQRKLHHVLRAARVKPGHRILEFGSGWGGLAITAARDFGAEVDTVTLSKEQKALADERIREAGLEGKIRVHLMDYRELPPEFEKAFDAFVSIEMVEHVGPKYYNTYFSVIDWALKSENAAAVVTSSTFPECRFTTYQPEDFMRKYMWPNSCLPSATSLISGANVGAGGRLTLEGVENHASHYPRTLREWGRRLESNLTMEAIAKDYPGVLKSRADFEVFKRKWQYLYVYAGAGFAKGWITCHMLTFARQNDPPAQECY